MHFSKFRTMAALAHLFGGSGALATKSTGVDLTTRDIPPEYLEYAHFVGSVPQRRLPSDPRLSFALYIPPTLYNPDPANSSYTLPKLPLLISVHGTSRDIAATERDLPQFAEEMHCAVLMPLFPAGLMSSFDLDSYKLSSNDTRTQLRSDLALIDMLDEIQHRWPGLETDKVYMMGFSGGGQFTHRFLYLYPERIIAASVGAPGHITIIDDTKAWPKGTADIKDVFGISLNVSAMTQVPVQMIVGGDDNKEDTPGGFWDWVYEAVGDDEDLTPRVGGRLDGLRELKSNWEEHGIETSFEVVDGVEHDSNGVRKNVLAWLGNVMKRSHEKH